MGGQGAQKKIVALAQQVKRIEFPDKITDTPAEAFDPADQMVASLARTVEDGDAIVLGSFTPLAYAAYMLAKLTRAP